MARLDDDSLVLSCPACGTFAQLPSGERDTICWKCKAHLQVQVRGRRATLEVAPPGEAAPQQDTVEGPPPLTAETEQALWPADTPPRRRASRFPSTVWVVLAIVAAGAALLFPNRRGPDRSNVLRTPDSRIEIELPSGWSSAPLPNAACQIAAVNRAQMESVCIISQQKADFKNLGSYGEILQKSMLQRLGGAEASTGDMILVNGHPTLRYEVTGTSSLGIKVGYVIAVVETETRFNEVAAFVDQSQLPGHRASLGNLAYGLREIAATASR